MHRNSIVCLVALVLAAACAMMASGRTMTGALGEKYTYSNRSFINYVIINWNGSDLPSFDCHVEYTNGADMDSLGDGAWRPLVYCMTVDGAQKIRVEPRSKLVLRDPWDGMIFEEPDTNRLCDCSGGPASGSLLWADGPEDRTVPWPRPRWELPGWHAYPDTCDLGFMPRSYYSLWVRDTDTIVINHPWGERIVFVHSLSFPDTIPVLPGMSLRLREDGTLDTPGNVLVEAKGDVVVDPDFPAESFFDVWNLSPLPATFELTADDSHGWGATPALPFITVPPGTFMMVPVIMMVPPLPVETENMVTLQATDVTDPTQAYWGAALVNVDTTATAVASTPAALWLGDCRPNPFNPTTEIPFAVGASGRVRIDVYNAAGRHVVSLFDGAVAPGPASVTWNGTDATGAEVASGVYFCRLEAAGQGSRVRKMVLLK